MEMFWMVWKPESVTGRHATEALALAEAERLARLTPGSQFFVLQANHMRSVDSMTRVALTQAVVDVSSAQPRGALVRPQPPVQQTPPGNVAGQRF